jgi:hypothetical protein
MSIARVRNAKNNSDSDHIANHNNTINSVDVIVGPKLRRQPEHSLNISSGYNNNRNNKHDRRQSNPARIQLDRNHDARSTIAR